MSEKAGLDLFRPMRLAQKLAVDEFEFALGRRWAAMFKHVRPLKPVPADDCDRFFGDDLFLVGRNDKGDDFAFPRADYGSIHLVRGLAQRETQPTQMARDATAYFRLMLADAGGEDDGVHPA